MPSRIRALRFCAHPFHCLSVHCFSVPSCSISLHAFLGYSFAPHGISQPRLAIAYLGLSVLFHRISTPLRAVPFLFHTNLRCSFSLPISSAHTHFRVCPRHSNPFLFHSVPFKARHFHRVNFYTSSHLNRPFPEFLHCPMPLNSP